MKDVMRKKLSESKGARWGVLALVSFTMLCGYFLTDVMSPLKPMLQLPVDQGGLGWDNSDYGFFTSAYGWFNVFLLMLIFGGMILDKMGVRFTGAMSLGIMVTGIGMKYWAITSLVPTEMVTIFGNQLGLQVLMASIGYAIFGVGIEIAGITVSKIIVKWFKGKELAMAMGLEMACARIGTALALGVTPIIASFFGGSISMPILMGLLLLCVGLLSFLVFMVMDARHDKELEETAEEEEPFRVGDILDIIRIKGFWYVAILCVLFYSAVFPFLKYAPDLMVNKFGVDEKLSGIIPSLLPFGTILLTPFFGSLYDRKGKGASIMMLGSLLIVLVHSLFAVPMLNNWVIALVLMMVLGVAFSLVPSAMWPSVPKIIPENKLGTAYALIFYIQNWGLMGIPYMIGVVLDKYCVIEGAEGATRASYDYTIPMVIFATLGLLSILISYLLKKEDEKMGFGLQLPNIKE
ncbi:MAG: MFS transporter [Bacteroidales bacterium]